MQDHASTATPPAAATPAVSPSATSLLQRIAGYHIGILPLPLYLVGLACVVAFVARGKVPTDLCIMAVLLSVCAFTLAEIGYRIPLLRSVGGPVILNTFLPSALVFYGIMPTVMVSSITTFYKQSNFLYLFVAAVVVGSIFAMDRKTLLANILKIVSPLVISSLAATVVGLAVGAAFGMEWKYTLFFILVPIMAGGVGEGAVPLAIGYAAIMHNSQAEMMGHILPIVAMANVCAVVIAGALNALGKRKPGLSGDGALLIDSKDNTLNAADTGAPLLADVLSPAIAGLSLLTLYAVSVAIEHLVDLPAPLIMLMLAVLMKMAKLVPPTMEHGARWVYRFFAAACTYPLIFTVGVVLTPWKPLVAAFSPAICITILATVLTLAIAGFLVARRSRMYPIETAIIAVCHAGSGGTGDVAILTAGRRLNLMATAQVSTKIGGFVTVTLALLSFSHFY